MADLSVLLLHTAFTCIACDGDIAPEEMELIKKLSAEKKSFGDIDIDKELKSLVSKLKTDGKELIHNYFDEIDQTELTIDDEVAILQMASDAINADEIIEYDEVKYFKSIRRRLSADDSVILEKVSGIDDFWLESDIDDSLVNYDSVYSSLSFDKLSLN